jgi:hypothetical protein
MNQIKRIPYLIEFVTVIGLVFYIAQSWYFANSLDSIGDEGAYLYKGYMFARGTYYPFQEYTFWTNKAPLAFLIPGYIQLWFGPGLGVARYFAIFISVLMLVGVWITARRLGGKGWAAVAVWVFTLATAQVSIYSEALSQGLIACMMAWMFVLTLGEDRPLWQLMLGSALSIIIVMTRQNMAVVPALLVLYIFWQYGKKAGSLALAVSTVLFLAFHAFYWPGILQIWAPWLPRSLTAFLDPFRGFASIDQSAFVFDASLTSRVQSLAAGLTDNFFVFFGFFSALALFPRKSDWKHSSRFKMAVFLGVTFFLLFVMHTLASLPVDYCVHCFSGYQMFFSTVGFFFLLIVFSNGLDTSRPRFALLIVVLLFFAAILGLNYYHLWGDWLLNAVQVPRLNQLLAGGKFSFISLKDIFTHTLNISSPLQRRIVSALGGIFLGIALIVLAGVFYRFLQRNQTGKSSLANILLASFLIFGTVFPFGMNWTSNQPKCSTNYLVYYEKAGISLSKLVPPGSLLYWRGSGRQLAWMLYVSDVRIFPPQIHAGAGYATGDTQRLYRMGFYNEELDKQWRASADILMVWDTYLTKEFRQFLDQGRYEQIPLDLGGLAGCEDPLYVFRRTS